MGHYPWRGLVGLVLFYFVVNYTTIGTGMTFIWEAFRPSFLHALDAINPEWVDERGLPHTYKVCVGIVSGFFLVLTIAASVLTLEERDRRVYQDFGTFAIGAPILIAYAIQAALARAAA